MPKLKTRAEGPTNEAIEEHMKKQKEQADKEKKDKQKEMIKKGKDKKR